MCAHINVDSGKLWEFYLTVSNVKNTADRECDDMLRVLKLLEEQVSLDISMSQREMKNKEFEVETELRKRRLDQERISKLRKEIVELSSHINEMTSKRNFVPIYRGEIINKKQVYSSAFKRGRNFLNSYMGLLDELDGETNAQRGEGEEGSVFGNYNKSVNNSGFYRMKFRGMTFYCNDSAIDVNKKDGRNRSNLKRMQKGMAPIGTDGLPINIHHMQQSETGGGMMELNAKVHSKNHSLLHINSGSNIPSGINRGAFNVLRRAYWKQRAKKIL